MAKYLKPESIDEMKAAVGKVINQTARYAVFKCSDDWEALEVEKIGTNSDFKQDADPKAMFEEFLSTLPMETPRYIAYQFSVLVDDSVKSTLLMACWCPETVRIKERMLYSGHLGEIYDILKKQYPQAMGTNLILRSYQTPDDLIYDELAETGKIYLR
eukprot:m.336507 g.336507  ORF g.336507 m.336507 type:complete len:158 (+) comp17873_c0_seq1:40-513(+)